jgi:MSHA biogenesis protein MshK
MAGAVTRWLVAAGALLWLGAAWAGATLPDPTRPPPSAPAAVPSAGAVADAPESYAVQSIVFGTTRRLAVINGRQVHEGSTLGEARVVQIQRDVVILEIHGQRRPVPMYASVVHKTEPLVARRPADTGVKNHE